MKQNKIQMEKKTRQKNTDGSSRGRREKRSRTRYRQRRRLDRRT